MFCHLLCAFQLVTKETDPPFLRYVTTVEKIWFESEFSTAQSVFELCSCFEAFNKNRKQIIFLNKIIQKENHSHANLGRTL